MVLACLTIYDLRPLDAVMRGDIRMTFYRLYILFIRQILIKLLGLIEPIPKISL